ncbi:GntR family transcriptional regulator [Streptomyces sp. NPDC059447]|uniref:GntR family transcriptional regulator n=1 Tax=Streptomyces sp. NPDC059447 TaxID=3346834 RepID=UPI0036C892BD
MPALNRTPKDAVDPRALHERIATDLRREILTGERPPGDKLPSTQALKERFDASSATIQKAVSMLKSEGLVSGRAGSAVTVLEHRREVMHPAAYSKPAETGRPYRWLEEAEKRGKAPSIQLVNVEEVRPPADIAAALDLGADGRAVLRQQLLSLDGEPCELVKSYYPLEIARGTGLAERRRIKGGTPTLLNELGYPPVRTIDLVTAEEPTQEEYAALQLPSPISVLRTFRVVLSNDDRPIEATTMAKAGHLYRLQYEF